MDILIWLGWALLGIVGMLWSLVWFLISGWVSTLLQIAVLIGAVFYLKYGWQRAPVELWRRAQSLARFVWSWVRAREPHAVPPQAAPPKARQVVRVVRVKEPGDINVSTLLSLLALAGFALLTALP